MPEFDGNPSKNQVFKAHYNGPPRNASVHAGLFCRGPVGSIHFFPTTTAGGAASSSLHDGVCFLKSFILRNQQRAQGQGQRVFILCGDDEKVQDQLQPEISKTHL